MSRFQGRQEFVHIYLLFLYIYIYIYYESGGPLKLCMSFGTFRRTFRTSSNQISLSNLLQYTSDLFVLKLAAELLVK